MKFSLPSTSYLLTLLIFNIVARMHVFVQHVPGGEVLHAYSGQFPSSTIRDEPQFFIRVVARQSDFKATFPLRPSDWFTVF